jgi:hypothetical protein
MIEVYDSIDPAKIPAGSHALVYYDGKYAAKPSQVKRFKATRWITVLGNYEHAGIADYEAGNEVFSKGGALRAWCEGRLRMDCRARVYCDRSNYEEAHSLVGDLPNVVWWIGTLDGNRLSATYVPKLWAVQFAGGPTSDVDTSVLYGTW